MEYTSKNSNCTEEEGRKVIEFYYKPDSNMSKTIEHFGLSRSVVKYYVYQYKPLASFAEEKAAELRSWFYKTLEKDPYYLKKHPKPVNIKQYPMEYIDKVLDTAIAYGDIYRACSEFNLNVAVVRRWLAKFRPEKADIPAMKPRHKNGRKIRLTQEEVSKICWDFLDTSADLVLYAKTLGVTVYRLYQVFTSKIGTIAINKYFIAGHECKNSYLIEGMPKDAKIGPKFIANRINELFSVYMDTVLNYLICCSGHISHTAEKYEVPVAVIKTHLFQKYPHVYDYFVNNKDMKRLFSNERLIRRILDEKQKENLSYQEIAQRYNVKLKTMVSCISKYLRQEKLYRQAVSDALSVRIK